MYSATVIKITNHQTKAQNQSKEQKKHNINPTKKPTTPNISTLHPFLKTEVSTSPNRSIDIRPSHVNAMAMNIIQGI